ncbi:BTAD domain-containing putative transcriptional regulator [Nocardioides sp.]|uniref:AfsR/SARP family transcriptional regulator n=1 Tax=Nocardioides sp. TaxID=35761 RepID=UPI00286B577C|nr:BTAD domain-containing putative transcriptional regulator [Nocardioides sp.]
MRIRLLGGFDVVRADGTPVEAAEWSTRKTKDLLRLLALSAGRPVRSSHLIEKLWPTATPERGRGSLRTAASQIRRTVGASCLARHPEGLILIDTRVDVVDFLELVRDAHRAAREERPDAAVVIGARAESLYSGDFHASDDDSPWARGERHRLQAARQGMLAESARCALQIGLPRDALELATTAVALDALSEGAHRSLMQAHAELGEIAAALRVYEHYRALLAEELGADPSAQTQELHLRILRGGADHLTG